MYHAHLRLSSKQTEICVSSCNSNFSTTAVILPRLWSEKLNIVGQKIESGAFVRAVKSLGNRFCRSIGCLVARMFYFIYTLSANINLTLNETLATHKVFS